mgnify:CR=1 FL=1|tara:strand:+ start:1113 stop:1796 length:684 start_codon:yes stop_codon:yes gene_type:complete
MKSGIFSALIAVREGSCRVPKKNIRNFAGTSLLKIKIEQAMKVKSIDKVFVSSDSEEMLNLALSLGATPIKRAAKYCSNSIPMNEVYKHLAESIRGDHIVYLHVTSPLLKSSTLEDSIETYKNLEDGYTSLASVEHLMKYIWFQDKAINYDPKNHPRSQDLAKYYSLNFAINILPRNIMIETKSILGKKFYPYFLNSEESIDVDTEIDFEVAEYIYKKNHKKSFYAE